MTPRLLVEPAAQADLDDAFAWYETRARGLGHEYFRAIRVVFAAIERNPQRYPKIRGEIRRALVQRFPYAVYYVADPDQPRVIACTHNRQHPRRWQSRR